MDYATIAKIIEKHTGLSLSVDPEQFNEVNAAIDEAVDLAISDSQRTADVRWEQLVKWRDFAQSLAGVDATDHGWLRAELDSQWRDLVDERDAAQAARDYYRELAADLGARLSARADYAGALAKEVRGAMVWLEAVRDELQDSSDVKDGPDGVPQPNFEMRLLQDQELAMGMLRAALAKNPMPERAVESGGHSVNAKGAAVANPPSGTHSLTETGRKPYCERWPSCHCGPDGCNNEIDDHVPRGESLQSGTKASSETRLGEQTPAQAGGRKEYGQPSRTTETRPGDECVKPHVDSGEVESGSTTRPQVRHSDAERERIARFQANLDEEIDP